MTKTEHRTGNGSKVDEAVKGARSWAPTGKEGYTVLLVDDEKIILDLNRNILESFGCKVLTARNGRDALELFKLKRRMIDLVMLDMIMPAMNGEETFIELKKIDPAVRVLISSGYYNHENIRGLLEKGCRGFLKKPFRIDDLLEKIHEVLGA